MPTDERRARPAVLSPNILITGTPGTGKTTIGREVANLLAYTYLNVGEIIQSEGFADSYDSEFDAVVPDEDRLLDFLEETLRGGSGFVLDFHSSELFPERWIAQHPLGTVIVLRCDTSTLHDRLAERKYPEIKIQENMNAEIMRVCLDEALESYPKGQVFSFQNNSTDDKEKIIDFVRKRIGQPKA
ncbi:hypothetical protein XU18_4676 [Perkinsela sp. CCAP 1560/4]|nr:hypothetical protein XU18_4676 [Perkinsela sp. CCAP 1560/4]|eukprot:KNH04006.1 hypothetical protein XU18_4676 [Perkinsela sp. CCAP 1560/4]